VKVLVSEAMRKDSVLSDRRRRLDIGEPMAVEPREATISDHRHGQPGARPAVEDLSDRRLQVAFIDPAVCVRGVLAFVRSVGIPAHRPRLISRTTGRQ
jgi:hypothetical protein